MKKIFAIFTNEEFQKYAETIFYPDEVHHIKDLTDPSVKIASEISNRNNVFIIDVHYGELLDDCNILNEIGDIDKIAKTEFKAKFIFFTWFPTAYLRYNHENGIKKNYYLSNLHSDLVRIYQIPLSGSDIDKMKEFIKS